LGEPVNRAGARKESPAGTDDRKVQLRLFVAGAGPRSVRAISDLKLLCQEYLRGECDVEIVDIYEQPERAAQSQIVAVPTLVREEPQPLRKFVGELGDPLRMARALGVVPA
jgi:circadian clock protein KaiB